jgi:hypothetical protein
MPFPRHRRVGPRLAAASLAAERIVLLLPAGVALTSLAWTHSTPTDRQNDMPCPAFHYPLSASGAPLAPVTPKGRCVLTNPTTASFFPTVLRHRSCWCHVPRSMEVFRRYVPCTCIRNTRGANGATPQRRLRGSMISDFRPAEEELSRTRPFSGDGRRKDRVLGMERYSGEGRGGLKPASAVSEGEYSYCMSTGAGAARASAISQRDTNTRPAPHTPTLPNYIFQNQKRRRHEQHGAQTSHSRRRVHLHVRGVLAR